MHIKKEKGDLGVVYAIAEITSQGWCVSLPISEHRKYDLIAEKDGVYKRVQVRYTTPKNDALQVKLRSIWNDKHGTHFTKRKSGDFDVLAVFNPHDKCTYFVSDDNFSNENAITLRMTKPKNCQVKKIRMAEDFKKFANI